MGEINWEQEQRVDEVSVQKVRENHETLQKLTSQLQEMQEQMNSMNDSGDYKMWNRITAEDCFTFPVNLWWFRVLALCSAATEDCRLTHGINLDYRKTLLETNFLRLIHPEIILKEFNLSTCKKTEKQSLKQKGRRLFTQVTTHLQQSRWLRVLQSWWNYSRILWSDSKDSKYRNCNSTNALIHDRSLVVLIFHRMQGCGSMKWSGWFFFLEKDFPNLEMLDAKIACAPNKIIQNSQFKKKVSLEEQKAQKEDRFLRGRQIAYLIYDYFRVTGIPDSVENYADLFTICLRNDDIQDFDSKWDGILLSMTKIPPDDILEGLYKLRIRESEKLKTVLEVYDLENHETKIGPDYHRLKTMVKRSIEQNLRNRNFLQKWKLWKERPGQESGDKTSWTKNSGRLLAMGSQRAVF